MKKYLFIAALIFPSISHLQAETIFGLTATNGLVSFDSATPATVTTIGVISQAGIVDIDFSPVNGALYGMTSDGSLYIINTTNALATLAVTPASTITGAAKMDFNPAADRLRIIAGSTGPDTATPNNFRLTPDASATEGGLVPGTVTNDSTFAYVAGDRGAGTTPRLVGAAYTNNTNNSGLGTTLYSLDNTFDNQNAGSDTDYLVIHSSRAGPPTGNFSDLTTVAPLRIPVPIIGFIDADLGEFTGFDISQGTGTAYVSTSNGTSQTVLSTLNLTTGVMTPNTNISSVPLRSIAVVAVPEPATASLLLFGGLLFARRTRRS